MSTCTTSKWVPGILANQVRFHGFFSIKILQISNGTKKKKIDAYLKKKKLTLTLSMTQILQLHNICHKWSIHLIKKHLITLHFLHCLINQERPIYLFLSHIFSITKQTQNAIFQNQPKKQRPRKNKFIPWNWKIRATTKRQVSRVPLPNPNHP